MNFGESAAVLRGADEREPREEACVLSTFGGWFMTYQTGRLCISVLGILRSRREDPARLQFAQQPSATRFVSCLRGRTLSYEITTVFPV